MVVDTAPEPPYAKPDKPHISLCPAYYHHYCGVDNCKCADPILKDYHCEKRNLNIEEIREKFREKTNK